MRKILFTVLMTLLATTPALAQGGGDDRPKGTHDSGVITFEQLQRGLQRLMTERYGIVVQYVLPAGWEVREEGVDPTTGKLRDTSNVYVLLSRRPMPNETDPTDFIFEMDIFAHDLLADAPAGADADKRSEVMMKGFWDFLNAQMSINVKGGLKTLTPRREIDLKLYGPEDGRPKTAFVPIAYEVPPIRGQKGSTGAKLFTFTSLTEGKIWVLKFLVSNDQLQNYEALIALIVNNAFGLSKEGYSRLVENTKKVDERARQAAQQQKQGK